MVGDKKHRLYQQILDKRRSAGMPYREVRKPVWAYPTGLVTFDYIQGIEMSEIKICVSIDDAHLPQIQQISEQLQSSGMSVEETLSSIGVITGSIESEQVNNLYQIEGVQNVESQQTYQIAPPDSDVQ